MTKSIKLILIMTFLFSGCASTWKSSQEVSSGQIAMDLLREEVPSNQAYLFVFRESGFRGSLTAWPVQLNNKKIGMIKNGGVLLIKVPPGEHYLLPEEHLGVFGGDEKINKINVEGGKRYFYSHITGNGFTVTVRFDSMSENEASEMIANYPLTGMHDAGKGDSIEEDLSGSIACTSWSSKNGISDEDKAWSDIYNNVETLRKEILKLGDSSFDYDRPIKISGKKIDFGKITTAIKVIEKVSNWDFEGAAKDVANETISYLVPVAGQYKALLDATKTSIQSVIDNWTSDIFLSPSYNKLRDIINRDIVRSKKMSRPYYPSHFLKKQTKLYRKMFKHERSFFIKWKASQEFEDDFDFGKTAQKNRARIRQLLKKEASPAEIYRLFYQKIVNDQKSYIEITYNETMEDLMYKESSKMKPKLIKAVCRELNRVEQAKKKNLQK